MGQASQPARHWADPEVCPTSIDPGAEIARRCCTGCPASAPATFVSASAAARSTVAASAACCSVGTVSWLSSRNWPISPSGGVANEPVATDRACGRSRLRPARASRHDLARSSSTDSRRLSSAGRSALTFLSPSSRSLRAVARRFSATVRSPSPSTEDNRSYRCDGPLRNASSSEWDKNGR